MDQYLPKLFLFPEPLSTLRTSLVSVEKRPNPKVNTEIVISTSRSIFCPQGGGQPSDQGAIESINGEVLARVVFVGSAEAGLVELYCNLPEEGDVGLERLCSMLAAATAARSSRGASDHDAESEYDVVLRIDSSRRELNCKLHSAGHLIDACVSRLGLNPWLKPGKGYHFIDNPNVEYEIISTPSSPLPSLLMDMDALGAAVADAFEALVAEKIATSICFEERAAAAEILGEALEGYPQVVRLVSVGGKACACGGTHVGNTEDLGGITVDKTKKKKNVLKISYSLALGAGTGGR
jgi:Ser-tRNA(Ala) deacylase AlaX